MRKRMKSRLAMGVVLPLAEARPVFKHLSKEERQAVTLNHLNVVHDALVAEHKAVLQRERDLLAENARLRGEVSESDDRRVRDLALENKRLRRLLAEARSLGFETAAPVEE